MNLSEASKAFKDALKKKQAEAEELKNKIEQLEDEKNEVLSAPVSKAEFKRYLLASFENESYIVRSELQKKVDNYSTDFSVLENGANFLNILYFSGGHFDERNILLFAGEAIAEKIISLMPEDKFNENALNKEQRLAKVAEIEAKITPLKEQRIAILEELRNI